MPPCLVIALPVPRRSYFDYLPPPGLDATALARLKPGVRVRVPFGRRQLIGMLTGIKSHTDHPADKLKTIIDILDEEPLLPPALLDMVLWAADYYQHPAGDALLSVLPTLLREGNPASTTTEKRWRLTPYGKGLPAGALPRAPRQSALLAALQQKDCSNTELAAMDFSNAILRQLAEKKLIESYLTEMSVLPASTPVESALQLNHEQQQAVDTITASKGFQSFLLQGVTGSGKTEVYLQAITKILDAGKQALVLVPEIGLTPQTIDRFQKRFHHPVVAFHSGLSNRERLDAWLQASRNKAGIIIGTRSAIFTPMPALGIIVIDEEHDGSFKQQEGFRYHARDVAIVRAQREKIPVVLGSATPSLESLNNARNQKYRLLKLQARAGNALLPIMQLVDMNRSKLTDGFATETLEAIHHELAHNNQVMVFLNRRGYAPTLICADCSWMAQCQHCSARLTIHKRENILRCHHCDWQSVLPRRCPSCHGHRLDHLGHGTQRSEEALLKHFQSYPVIRIDRDSVRRKEAWTEVLNAIHRSGPAILTGTQMIAKGHHFPHVTLVVILDADSGLFSADFRSSEKFIQLITQVAGRAGRAGKTGRVLIQSRLTDHPLLQSLIVNNHEKLAMMLLAERQTLDLPPCRAHALIRCESRHPEAGEEFLADIKARASRIQLDDSSIQLIGPLPSLMEKKAGWFRQELVFYSAQRTTLQTLLRKLAIDMEGIPSGKKLRWHIDVDPG